MGRLCRPSAEFSISARPYCATERSAQRPMRAAYNGSVGGGLHGAEPRKGRILPGVLVMGGIALLQLASEFVGARDVVRLLSKSAALPIGLPVLVICANRVFRWART